MIGGGHNGLVAATYLARAGRRVAVLERRAFVGGAAATEEFHPGFRGPTGAALCGLLRPEIIRDLRLADRGLTLLPANPEVAVHGTEGKVLRIWRDDARTRADLAGFSPRDAEAYFRFRSFLTRIAGVLDPLLVQAPPEVSEWNLGDQFFLLRRALKLRRFGKDVTGEALRMAPMSLRAVLNEWFETELLKASLAVDALIGTNRGPWSPETAFGLLRHFGPRLHGMSWSFVRGGMGALSTALAAAAQAVGVAIRAGAEVTRILTVDGRVTGVQLASGETTAARFVLSNADPKRTFLQLVDPAELDLEFVRAVRGIQIDGCVARVNLALDAIPAMPEDGGAVAPHFRIAPSLEYLERAYDDGKYGGRSAQPFLDVTIPTLVDPELAPAGNHVMSALVQYAPYRLRRGAWDDERDNLGDAVVDILDESIPGLRGHVLGREVLTPLDMERRLGLTGGHIHHGEMTLNQQLFLRPVPGWSQYRTPIAGLYLCGSGAHPGGGITGAPGYNCARAILEREGS
ncbi:MAG TPA: NAD(P)/FAD-dependent oxidoreductase [Thermoplasmata archaeon]